MATELGLPSKVFSLDAPNHIAEALAGIGLVLNCAGPFSKAADPLMRACLTAKAHYLDITGEIDFGRGPMRAMPIPWGDVASAYYTTGIPNITVFTSISWPRLAIARLMNAFGFILQSPRVQTWLIERIGKTVKGPDAAARDASPTRIWGEAKGPSGRRQEIRISSLNGYSLTVFSSLAVVEHLIAHGFAPGCWTPAAIMEKDFIFSLPGTSKPESPRSIVKRSVRMTYSCIWFYTAILKIADPVCLRYDSGRYAAKPAISYPATFFLAHRTCSDCTLTTQI